MRVTPYASVSLACVLLACTPRERAPSIDLGPGGVLLVCQSRFLSSPDGRPVPQPAHLAILRQEKGGWRTTTLDDTLSNVFHKAFIVVADAETALFTIGGDRAALTKWRPGFPPTHPQRLWQPRFGGAHDRIRDIERGDVNGDGRPDLVMATHDQGVIAVGHESDAGWSITQVDSSPSTFVHEIEIGDVDGDGTLEFYATPSQPNRASGASQPGAVVRFAWDGTRYAKTLVDSFPDTHAKEILVADLDGKGDRLFVVKEGVTSADGRLLNPVSILRYWREGDSWRHEEVTSLPDRQCRFLLACDLDGDGRKELVAAGFKSGLWWIVPTEASPWRRTLIDASSSGFEHACTCADMDGDGLDELYVAADDQKELRAYLRVGAEFRPLPILAVEGDFITWSVTAGRM